MLRKDNIMPSTVVEGATSAKGGKVRKVEFGKLQIGGRSKLAAKEGAREAPLPRPVVSVGSEEVNGENLTVINIKLFGRPQIVDKDGFKIERKKDGTTEKVLTGEKTLMLRLADTRSGVPMMQQLHDEDSDEVVNDRVMFTLPNPDIPEASFDEENPEHWLNFAGVIQARAYGKLEADVQYRRKGKEAGLAAAGQGQTAETQVITPQDVARIPAGQASAGFANAPTE